MPSLVVDTTFDMPGVPIAIVKDMLFVDKQAATAFVPRFRGIKVLRGKPCTVGYCFEERRAFGSHGEVVLRKTVTNVTEDPHFTISAAMEIIKGSWRWPRLASTNTTTIFPYRRPKDTQKNDNQCTRDKDNSRGDDNNNDQTEDVESHTSHSVTGKQPRSNEEQDGCTLHWTGAFIAAGCLAKALSVFCVPCLRRKLVSDYHERMQLYHQEGLRRAAEAAAGCNDASR